MPRSRAGFTLVETLLAGSLFLLLTLVLARAVLLLGDVYSSRDARLDTSRSTRQLLTSLGLDLRQACVIFSGFSGTIQGRTFQVPAPGASGPDLVFARPDSSQPSNTTYTVVTVYARLPQVADPRNPTAQQVAYLVYPGVSPVTAGVAATIDLAALAGPVARAYDCSLTPASLTFQVDATSHLATVGLWAQRQPQRGVSVLRQFGETIALRLNY